MATTPQLYDPGEESMERRLHVGCGSIYLKGYINLDVSGFHPYERPDLVEVNSTSITDYYGRRGEPASDVIEVPPPQETVLDCIGDMRDLPYSGIDKIVCIQAFEHLTRSDADRTLLNWWNCLKLGGIVIISVPDPVATLELLKEDNRGIRDFAIRHMMGSGTNVYALHHWAYTEANLRSLLTGYGFVDIERLPNIHFYPAIILKARKSDPWDPGRGYQRLPALKQGWKILDVGPGRFPFHSATHFLDLKRYEECPGDIPYTIFDLNSGEKLPFDDDEFDFVYCSHVLEHLDYPIAALEDIQRVGRRGYVEIPSVLIDFMFQHGETHPRWLCWKHGDALLFIEKTEEQNRLFSNWGASWGGFFHSAAHGKRLTAPQRAIRFFFWQNQGVLNISASWDKTEDEKQIHGQELRLDEDT